MNEEKINKSPKKLRILVAPLDWGLGHATRCIPIIHTLLKHNADVVLAADGTRKILLQREFPQVKILDLKGYDITYSRSKKYFILKLITQLPKLLFAIRTEEKWLNKIIQDEKIDAVISDNRPGLHHSTVPCVYITHQLQIQTASALTDRWLRNLHYRYINKFQQCWIPDNGHGQTLAGRLSHPVSYPKISYIYLGLLSRFQKKTLPISYDFLLLISGPEPQRSILEKKLLKVFENSPYSFALVRGMPANNKKTSINNLTKNVFDHLDADELNELILRAETVVARSGYSTVMDLAKLQKKAILIATPGQTEQEYLAKFLDENKIFASLAQAEISLANIEKASSQSDYVVPVYDSEVHEAVVGSWLTSLRQTKSAI